MENYKITCYIPGSGLNLFKIKSICSFHTLCSTSLQQSTVEYSVTLKIGCNYDKLITLILWLTASRYFGSLPSFLLIFLNYPNHLLAQVFTTELGLKLMHYFNIYKFYINTIIQLLVSRESLMYFHLIWQ